MYESLKKHSDAFHLYIFAFDSRSYKLLKKLDLAFVTVVSLEAFEDEELLKAKEDRSAGEYCWTCTPSTIKYCIETYNLDSCTYLDADLYFFNNPSILIEEMGDKSVLITEHRYTPEYDQSTMHGKYCVQFMTFKNDKNGMKVLNWWRDACNEWCYSYHEDGKFGDQKYLDHWKTSFEGIHELQHLGGGLAPWNIQQYHISSKNGLHGVESSSGSKFNVVFYHFQNFQFLENNKISFGFYILGKSVIELLYRPYARHLEKITNDLKCVDKENDYNGIVQAKPFHWKDPLRTLKRKLKPNYNIFDKTFLLEDRRVDGILYRFTNLWR